jgi:hypothetical protein
MDGFRPGADIRDTSGYVLAFAVFSDGRNPRSASFDPLRTQAEVALGRQFDLMAFNDFIVAQGLLPPRLLEQAVMEEFVRDRSVGEIAVP